MITTNTMQYDGKNVYDMKKHSCFSRIDSNTLPIEVKQAQKDSIEKVFTIFKGFLAFGIHPALAIRCLNQKIKIILGTTSVEDAIRFGDFCLPICASDRDLEGYVPEEELIALAICDKIGRLSDEAQERYKYLYKKCFEERSLM